MSISNTPSAYTSLPPTYPVSLGHPDGHHSSWSLSLTCHPYHHPCITIPNSFVPIRFLPSSVLCPRWLLIPVNPAIPPPPPPQNGHWLAIPIPPVTEIVLTCPCHLRHLCCHSPILAIHSQHSLPSLSHRLQAVPPESSGSAPPASTLLLAHLHQSIFVDSLPTPFLSWLLTKVPKWHTAGAHL